MDTDIIRCSHPLARPSGGRLTCSRVATRDGLCTQHANAAARQGVIVQAIPQIERDMPPLIEDFEDDVPDLIIPLRPARRPHREHGRHEREEIARRRYVKAKRREKVVYCGEVFECQLCTEEKVPIEHDMQLECGDKICQTCFDKLSDKLCPYCRVDMKSKKITTGDLDDLERKKERFKSELEEESFREFLRQEIGLGDLPNMVPANILQFIMMTSADDIMPQPLPPALRHPELGDEEDTDMMIAMINAINAGDINIESDEQAHSDCHEVFPDLTCDYLRALYTRVREIM